MFGWIRKHFTPKPKIRFKCTIGGYYTSTPVVTARSVFPEWLKGQLEKKNVKFVQCPGMHDHSHHGYLIRAWTDIHIKANSMSLVVDLPLAHAAHEGPDIQAKPMDYELVGGLAPVEDGVAKRVMKLTSPWSIYTEPGYSAYVLPAWFHSNFFDKLYVYPGIVDYEKFHTVNFIFSAIKPCEFVIPMGTPLLQVIPFKVEDFHAVSGKATEKEKDQHFFNMRTRVKSTYRKMFHRKKVFTIEVDQ
jgi:hypothetical protein